MFPLQNKWFCFGWSNWIFHAYCLTVCESTSLLLTRCCHYLPAPQQVVVLKCLLCFQTPSEAQQICYWTWRGLKAVPGSLCAAASRGGGDKYATLPKSLHTIVLSTFSCININPLTSLPLFFATLHFKLPACVAPASFPFRYMQLPCPACPNPSTGFLCEWKWDIPDSRRITVLELFDLKCMMS